MKKEKAIKNEPNEKNSNGKNSIEKNVAGKKPAKKKKKPIIIAMVITVFLVVGATFTWYLFTKDNHADRQEVQVMAPYFLYLLNPDDQSSLQFSVGNIHPGEIKQIVICVSNKKPVDVEDGSIDIARESKFTYDLEFIYTENLPVNYNIYELQKYGIDETDTYDESSIMVEGIDDYYWNKSAFQTNADGTPKPLTVSRDVTSDRLTEVFGTDNPENVVNSGKYLLYQEDGQADPQPLGLEYKDDEYEFDYYLIEISWQDGITFSDYTKETDLLYVVVNAKQPLPKEQATDSAEISGQTETEENETTES